MSDRIVEWAEWINAQCGVLCLCESSIITEREAICLEIEDPEGTVHQVTDVVFTDASLEIFLLEYGYCVNGERVTFGVPEAIVRDELELDGNLYLAGTFNNWLSSGLDENWQLKREKVQGENYFCLTVDKNFIPASGQFKFVTSNWNWVAPSEFYKNKIVNDQNTENLTYNSKHFPNLKIFSLESSHYRLANEAFFHVKSQKIKIDELRFLSSLKFDGELGAIASDKKTQFALFAPRALSVTLFLKRALNDDWKSLPMAFDEITGVWSVAIEDNLVNYYYNFLIRRKIKGAIIEKEITDPYARALVNNTGPGIITSSNHFTKNDGLKSTFRKEALVIYECHLRDLLANFDEAEGKDKCNFSGLQRFIESGYFQQLGINAIELQPIQEFDYGEPHEYHWGYMPVNYFAPASAYASDPEKASQIKEIQNFIKICHQNQLAVLLDVVYNHAGANSSLYWIDERYYFRTKGEFLTNDSGCGNDLKTENAGVQKLVMESLEHWVREYDIDGFRFDLAELVGIKFLDRVRERLEKIKPGIVMIAEPWSFRRNAGHDVKATKLLAWNDEFRNFLKQYVLGQGNTEGLRYFLRGSIDYRSSFPEQSVNYLSSHDDFCWLDSITEYSNRDAFSPTLNDLRRTHIALAILLLSQGTPMLGEGIELLHTKRGIFNTYERGDLNALPYDRILEYPQTGAYLQQLIALRKRSSFFHQETIPQNYLDGFESKERTSAFVALLGADQKVTSQILLAINPHFEKATFLLKNVPTETFQQIADTFSFNTTTHYKIKGEELEVPPLSCGIWIQQ